MAPRARHKLYALTIGAMLLPTSSGALVVTSCTPRAMPAIADQVTTPLRTTDSTTDALVEWPALPEDSTSEAANAHEDTPLHRCAGAVLPASPRPTHARCDAGGNGHERVSILHISDMHARWQPAPHGRSPLAVLRAYVARRQLETGGRVLFLDAGDDLEKGSIADVRSAGAATIHLLDRIGLDARTLGNHDFAYGIESVVAQTNTESFDVLASNINPIGGSDDSTENFMAAKTSIIQVGCARIGVFGLVIDAYDERDERSDAPYLGRLEQHHDVGDHDRYVNVATKLVAELRDRDHVDAVIALDHLGTALDKSLVDEVPGLDVVVAGHDHRPIYGYARGRYGIIVDSGSFLGGPHEARVGEVALDIDVGAHSATLAGASAQLIDTLADDDVAMEHEVHRMLDCFASDADQRLTDLTRPMRAWSPQTWTPIVDAALHRQFPRADALIYETWDYGGPIKGELAAGVVTPQRLLDAAYVEKQRAGGPGFTAFVGVDVQGSTLRAICSATLRESPGRAVRRVCPAIETIDVGKTYRLVIERRPFYAPDTIFYDVPAKFPKTESIVTPPSELYEMLVEYARARGKSCLALDSDAAVTCTATARSI